VTAVFDSGANHLALWRPTNIRGGRREDGIDVKLVVVLSP
jgi:hypothetical protein